MAHPLAGQPVKREDLIQVDTVVKDFFRIVPTYDHVEERVSFGTSGHRGIASKGTFNELHVAAIVQAICDVRHEFGATGPCYIGQDTHALSQPALQVAIEVLVGNKVRTRVDAHREFVPTPSVSRAILRHNATATAQDVADGIIITPSHNPPEHGGIKYNPPHGGPADTAVTKRIEALANEYLQKGLHSIQRFSFHDLVGLHESAHCGCCHHEEEQETFTSSITVAEAGQYLEPYDFKMAYVKELPQIIDMAAIQKACPKVLINALGGSGGAYWHAISEEYNLGLDIINSNYDPTFSFMSYDHDGAIRMDCSSPYAMAEVANNLGDHVLAIGNDPDYDRHGIVTKDGLLAPNQYLVVAAKYLNETRPWDGKGVGKTAVVTGLMDAYCNATNHPVYEVPVGFKYFAPLLFDGRIGLGAEESAGASFLQRDGSVWTTDKDGIILGLLAIEMVATTGQTPADHYATMTAQWGTPVFQRIDMPCTAEIKRALKGMQPSDVKATELGGSPIVDIRTTSLFENQPIDGVKIVTDTGWFVARPSGTENLYKMYAESYAGEEGLARLMEDGKAIIESLVAQ